LIDEILSDAKIATVRTGDRMPRMSAIMERRVKTLRPEMPDRTLIWNETRLRHGCGEYERYCNLHRIHQSLAAVAPLRSRRQALDPDKIECLVIRRHDRLGGVLHGVQTSSLTFMDVVFGTHKASTMLACDFFHVDCALTLKRIYVFFVLEVGSRYVHILGATTNPDGEWTTQQIRNLVMDLGDRGDDFRFLVRDRAGQFTASLDAVLADVGIETRRIPPRCPRANCYAERFVRTARTELTDRMLILNERHLQAVLTEYVRHYNGRRPHRSRELRPPRPTHPVADLNSQRIKRQRLLGGLINEYERAA
jgi:transposase InsO family protein